MKEGPGRPLIFKNHCANSYLKLNYLSFAVILFSLLSSLCDGTGMMSNEGGKYCRGAF